MKNTHFDYAIIGAGAAGLHLALAMTNDDFFLNKKILIIEKDLKDSNDRTWSFWEKEKGKFDSILENSWKFGEFHSDTLSKKFDLGKYRYKTLRSSSFYSFSKKKINSHSNFIWVHDEVEKVEFSSESSPTIYTHNNTFTSTHVFDSRVDEDFNSKEDSNIRLLQHFKGWFIKTETPAFDVDKFIMMDFRLKWKNHTSFIYVLPFSPTEAIIEFTLFDQAIISDNDYDLKIKKYLDEFLKLKNYTITEKEKGVIPMTDFPFYKQNNNQLTKIGTAGGWVKPSSGYAFKNCEKNAYKVVGNLKSNRIPSHQLFNKRYQWYDTILLDILWNKNELGSEIFTSMFKHNSIESIFKFLDEEGTILSDLSIIKSFHPTPFLKTVGKRMLSKR